jgi:galactose mutarotase-like enzyme
MNAIDNNLEVRKEQGFAVYVIGNQNVELAVVPELGAKIISLKNLQTGREWMWHPQGGLKLFRNLLGDDFSKSPLVGADECLPTVAPCTWQGRHLPDHGEVWNIPWQVDATAWDNGGLKTSANLSISPFDFTRTIELQEDEVQLVYELTNRNAVEEHYLWAMHPLIRLEDGDRFEMPAHTRTLLDGETWVDAVDSALPHGKCAKAFARPIQKGFAAVYSRKTGERLEFKWDPVDNNTLGVWLTRGGWHGHHHFALEPTNSDHDALAIGAEQNRCGIIAGSSSVNWQVRLRVSS